MGFVYRPAIRNSHGRAEKRDSFVLLLSYSWSTSAVDKCRMPVDKNHKNNVLTSISANCTLYRQVL
jgi:hypothetical protein